MTAPPSKSRETGPRSAISRVELVALLGMLTAIVAFSIDAMLPSIPHIGADLSPEDPNRAQLVVASFVFGMGFGTLLAGPLSDRFGRKPVAVAGTGIYILAALVAAASYSIEALLVARAVQGFGAAGPRVATMALIRDLFSGRHMARIMSFIMVIFTIVPVLAPSLGALIAWSFGWRAIFAAFAVFGFSVTLWLVVRQPETLAPENRRPFRVSKIASGAVEVYTNRRVVLAMGIQTLIFSSLFSVLMSAQPIFETVFDRADTFPFWFGFMALIATPANFLNAAIVTRLGMRTVVKWALLVECLLSGAFLVINVTGLGGAALVFPAAVVWMTSIFYLAGLGIGNMNAIAMEPMGHIAGLAASVIVSTVTVVSAVIASPIGQAFDGTMRPLVTGVFVLSGLAFLLILALKELPEQPLPRA